MTGFYSLIEKKKGPQTPYRSQLTGGYEKGKGELGEKKDGV